MLIVFFAPIRYIIFDLNSGNLITQNTIFLCINTSTTKLNLKDIAKVSLEKSESLETSRITLLLKSGDRFPLTFGLDSDPRKAEMTQAIAQFLENFEKISNNT